MASADSTPEVKAGNSQEHLRVLQNELEIVSKDLVDKIESKKVTERLEAESKERLFNLRIEEESVNRATAARLAEAAKKEQEIADREIKFETYRAGQEADFAKRADEMVSSEKAYGLDMQEKKTAIDEVNVRLLSLTKLEETTLISIEENKKILEVQEREKSVNENVIDSQRVLFSEELARQDQKITEKRAELASVQAEVEAEREKVRLPEQNLRARTQELDRRKSDLDIYEGRIRARWAFLFPGRSLNIQ